MISVTTPDAVQTNGKDNQREKIIQLILHIRHAYHVPADPSIFNNIRLRKPD